jgi:hypothetical protein
MWEADIQTNKYFSYETNNSYSYKVTTPEINKSIWDILQDIVCCAVRAREFYNFTLIL